MNINGFHSYDALSEAAGTFIVDRLSGEHARMLCAATGGSPTGMYQWLADHSAEMHTKNLTVLKLDEWFGLPMDHAGSCEAYLKQYLLEPLAIDSSNYISFNSMASDAPSECRRIQQELRLRGHIDVCVLGLGMNGHLALNEPGESLTYDIHLAELAESSKQHPMIADSGLRLTHGLTLGMGDIMAAKTIVLLVNGPAKKTIFNQLMQKKISTRLPASLLWLHPDVHCFHSE